jgi:hypothetical protein
MDFLNFNPDHEPGGACPLHMPMSLRSATLLLDFSVWRRTSSIEKARRAAWDSIWTQLRSSEHSACFQVIYESFPSTPAGAIPPWPGDSHSDGRGARGDGAG